MRAFEANDFKKALTHLRPAAKAGDAKAAYYFGSMYFRGQGIEQDLKRAFHWVERGANAGYPPAQMAVGYSYSNGYGVPTNYVKAIKWYTRAAEQGHVLAQRNLALIYQEGWDGSEEMSLAYVQGKVEPVERDLAKAVHWFRRAAEQGDLISMTELGQAYWMGDGVESDVQTSMQWLYRAAEQDHAEAQYLLCSKHISLYPQHAPELVEGMAWCKLAADQDYPGGESTWEGATKWFVTEEQKRQAIRLADQWADHHR